MSVSLGVGSARRVRARVEGTVQGVGFRPHVYRRAAELGLAGWVLNDERGVLLEVEGPPAAVDGLLRALRSDPPPLASVERVHAEDLDPVGEHGFRILESEAGGEPYAPVTPDSATCEDCLAELFDLGNRRYRYPFINCTNCGPRFTIVRGVPYDRPLTTMVRFPMCARCRAEYDDPADRRFHAQPNACPECGPAASLVDSGGRAVGLAGTRDAVEAAARALAAGAIVAVKGIGGYHLACRADDERAVAALRARKHREDRPFALMAPDLEVARGLAELGPAEESLLGSPERPIVIAPRRPAAGVAPSVAPRSGELGLMLPYSPLHHLLLADAGLTLVMTSGNVSDEPIAYRDEDALRRLRTIADLFLTHDRPIHTRTDDSVVRAVSSRRPLLMRRSRGYVPASVELPLGARRAVLACGAELKSTFCLAKGARAWVGHHIGDLKNYETLRSFREGVERFQELFAVEPEVVAHDLHPDYLSTAYALEREGVEHLGVQHHHAHLAACLAEHGDEGAAVGAIYDGTGYGSDGTVWGGELLVGDLRGFERPGCLWPVRMPGGEQAIREPWRMACAWLQAALGEPPPLPRRLDGAVDEAAWLKVAALARSGLASPETTSVGRLFDAVAAICGLRARVTYEGQAAAELEAAADRPERGSYPLPLAGVDGELRLDARETLLAIVRDLGRGAAVEAVAARFHNALAGATAEACVRLAEGRALSSVVLSGGVFQNRLLLERTAEGIERAGLRPVIPERLPPNDGGISFGQAAVAAAREPRSC
ncbi:MAG TPA: carbamoyltransferase HypF [Thermoleophilaceae bacterium]|nr:carbamoyltransferase HypF [Thermoleophilaceae bacterium]